MKYMRLVSIWVCVCFFCSLLGCSSHSSEIQTQSATEPPSLPVSGMIYLYGEQHSNADILELELALWLEYYHEQGMRHLFVEYPYYTAGYLNLWMQAEDDAILEQLFSDWEGTQGHSEETWSFLKSIKESCPETVFHGTDIGHQYDSTGYRYRDYLKNNGLSDSHEYQRTIEAIEQGQTYYAFAQNRQSGSEVYRENTMTGNFVREFDALVSESVMGIYGSAHIDLDSLNHSGECDSMGTQLHALYGDRITSENLQEQLLDNIKPERTETIEIMGKSYAAEYFGKVDLSAVLPQYSHREFWHLVDAYTDFSEGSITGNVLPQNNYPMRLETGEAYMVQYMLTDGTVRTEYHICNGSEFSGQLTTYEVAFN